MIRVEHADLAAGLYVVACRRGDRDVTMRVSRMIPAAERRAAVRSAMCAARHAGWVPTDLRGVASGTAAFAFLCALGRRITAVKAAVGAGATVLAAGTVTAAVVVLAPVTQPSTMARPSAEAAAQQLHGAPAASAASISPGTVPTPAPASPAASASSSPSPDPTLTISPPVQLPVPLPSLELCVALLLHTCIQT